MKRMEGKLDDLLDRHLGLFKASSRKEPDAAREDILNRLQSQAAITLEEKSLADTRPRRFRRSRRFLLAAAASLVLVVLSTVMLRRSTIGARAVAEIAEGGLFRVSGGRALHFGDSIEASDLVRAGETGATLTLADGSRVEMRSQSGLSLERADDGVRIRLNQGGVIVNAAKQGKGHLYVQTKDAMVSVIGTVFLMNAEAAGSRVGVVEGEVKVRYGTELKTLNAGEQMATASSIVLRSLAEEIAWSRNAPALLALLPQSLPTQALPVIQIGQPLPTQALPQTQIGLTRPKPPVVEPTRAPAGPADDVDLFIRQVREEQQQREQENRQLVDALHPPPPGKEIFARACNGCHRADVAWRSYPSLADAENLISREVSKGAMLSPAEASALADYLFSYGGKLRP